MRIMKNIHVIATDKPTGIFKSGDNLLFSIMFKVRTNHEGFHIYITSDEEIKDVRPHKDKWQLEKGSILNKFPDYLTDLSECKLVIMTTDPDLIADGVQAIDDEFLNWFVKNPSCEEVEIRQIFVPSSMTYGINTNPYKIIIPTEEPKFGDLFENLANVMSTANFMFGVKEEPKQDYSGVHLRHCYQGEYEDSCKYGENDCPAKPLEEPKQEIVKDLAYWKANAEEDYMKVPISVLRYVSELEKQKYSEEDMFEFSQWIFHNDWVYLPSKGYWVNEEEEELEQKLSSKEILNIWFEQFKKQKS